MREPTEKTKFVKLTEEKVITYLEYSSEYIKDLILQDAAKKGYRVAEVKFLTDWKYVGDEWGMNRSPMSSFRGAEVGLWEEVGNEK